MCAPATSSPRPLGIFEGGSLQKCNIPKERERGAWESWHPLSLLARPARVWPPTGSTQKLGTCPPCGWWSRRCRVATWLTPDPWSGSFGRGGHVTLKRASQTVK